MTSKARTTIRSLDPVSQTRIRSAVRILSLNDIVIGLLENALDAEAHSVSISINYSQGFCSVQDDGFGISEAEFAAESQLAQPYCTSKQGAAHGRTFGGHGQFLAALTGIALLSIASKTSEGVERVLLLDENGRVGRSGRSHELDMVQNGTKVKVYNLFAKFPVRIKYQREKYASRREIEIEFERLRYDMAALKLASATSAAVRVEELSSHLKFGFRSFARHDTRTEPHMEPQELQSTLRQAGLIPRGNGGAWDDINLDTGNLCIQGKFSSEPMPSKKAQFISLEHWPLPRATWPEIYELVNSLYASSTFAQHQSDSPNSSLSKLVKARSKTAKSYPQNIEEARSRVIDKYPAFFVRVLVPETSCLSSTQNDFRNGQNERLKMTICNLLKSMLCEYLTECGWLNARRHEARNQDNIPYRTAEAGAPGASSTWLGHQSCLNYWSRGKSSHSSSTATHLLAGLPFTTQATSQNQNVSSLSDSRVNDSALATTQLENSVSGDLGGRNKSCVSMESSAGSNPSNDKENLLEWRDPRTGATFSLDSRTGVEVSQRPTKKSSVSNVRSTISGSSLAVLSNSSRLRKSKGANLTPFDTAQNIDRYARRLCQPDFELHASRIPSPGSGSKDALDLLSSGKTFQGRFGNVRSTTSSSILQVQLSRQLLDRAQVIAQVDRKFILISLPSTDQRGEQNCTDKLVLVDQHAASERCQVEDLFRSLEQDPPQVLETALIFEVSAAEARRLDALSTFFARWRIFYHCPVVAPFDDNDDGQRSGETTRLYVEALPAVVAERCRLNPQLVIDMLREQCWLDNQAIRDTHSSAQSLDHSRKKRDDHCCDLDLYTEKLIPDSDIPARLLDLINSRACRSAIMFNDFLDQSHCERLIKDLSTCTLPFQCAHGRPSMHILADRVALSAFQYSIASLTAVAQTWTSERNRCSPRSVNTGLNTLDGSRDFGSAWYNWS